MRRIWFVPFALAIGICQSASAEVVEIINRFGGITIRSDPSSGFKVGAESIGRAIRPDDVRIRREPGRIFVICDPADKIGINLVVRVTYMVPVAAQTVDGAIELDGFFPNATITTQTGNLRLKVPWNATEFQMDSEMAPDSFVFPKGFKFPITSSASRQPLWSATDNLPDLRVTYGMVRVKAFRPKKVELLSIPIPADSPVKMHWQAPDIVDEILASSKTVQAKSVTASPSSAAPGESIFRSDVRIVNLQLSIRDANGNPMSGLTAADFEVFENGVRQDLSAVSRDEVPFNLVILLDLSGSTRNSRGAMKAAALKFAGMARPKDKVAIYALVNSEFQVLSRLTQDRARLERIIEELPRVEGGSPVYDSIVLAYAEELRQHAGEKNAMIVVSDGIDNQISRQKAASETPFNKLRQAIAGFDTFLYPVFLNPYKYDPPRMVQKAKEQMLALAKATGGRLFEAASAGDLEPAYPLVAEELGNVQSLAYSPKNQNFNGAWRKVEVRVKKPGATVGTRPGYYAR
jgi:VWFA-related protein